MICADLWSCVFHFAKEKWPGKCVSFSSNPHKASAYHLKFGIPGSSYPRASALEKAPPSCASSPKENKDGGNNTSLHTVAGHASPHTNPIHHLPDAISYQQFCCLFNASVCLSILKYHLLVLLSRTAHVHSYYTSKVTNEQSS